MQKQNELIEISDYGIGLLNLIGNTNNRCNLHKGEGTTSLSNIASPRFPTICVHMFASAMASMALDDTVS